MEIRKLKEKWLSETDPANGEMEIAVDRHAFEDFLKMKFPASTCQFRYGRQMRNEHFGSDETIWKFPEGVEIEDDKKYRVCYTKRDNADSSDSSTYYTVHFIEEW